MFTKALAASVTVKTRLKGLQYFNAGRVVDISGAEWVANGVVRGSRDYRVDLVRDRSRFTGACECPFYADRAEICKHIWAALLEAEDRNLLAGDGPVGDDAVLEPEYRPTPADVREHQEASYAAAGGRTQVVKPPAWQRFLHELQQDVAAAEGSVPLPRFSNGEIVYAIDVRGTLAGRGTIVSVFFRQRRKSGAWTKPKPVGITPAEAEHMLDRDDREILSLLIGASNAWYQTAQYEAGYPRLSRYVLNGPLEDRLLPMLARTGRAHLDGTDEQGLLPISWDVGDPWKFQLEVTSDDRNDTIQVDGAFVRGAERMALREPVLLLSRGFLFTRTTMAR
ncbi:MAG: hypothetical protein V7647_3299, partial [Acidobacteriota bacterium]